MEQHFNTKFGIKILVGFLLMAMTALVMGVYAISNMEDDKAISILWIMIIGIILISLLAGAYFSSLVTKPLKQYKYLLSEIIDGHFNKRIDYTSKDEFGEVAGLMNFVASDLEDYVVGTIKQISDGNVEVEILTSDEQDVMANAFKKTLDAMKGIHSEIQGITKAVTAGELNRRGNPDLYSGIWKELVIGINELMEAFTAPFYVTASYIQNISRGEIPPQITDSYEGYFNEMKNSINGCVDTMNRLLSDTNGLIRAAKAGTLDIRGDAQTYPGDWGVLVNEINHLIDAFVEPINMTAEYVERISKGDIPETITAVYYGDFNIIKDNINRCIDTMNALLIETNEQTRRILDGQLSARGNASAFSGKWSSLVEGMNALSEALVNPITTADEYFGRLSKGDIPDKITETYHGEFNNIKSSINTCIDIMRGLLRETKQLTKAVENGQLDVRANEDGYSGGWKELVAGINKLVDTIAEPVNEITAVMTDISEGKLNTSVKGGYLGQFKELSDSVNNTAEGLNLVIEEISNIIGQIAAGNLKMDPVKQFIGDFGDISNSLNTILNSLNRVLGEINHVSEQVSSGSKQVSDGSQSLSQGSTEQAGAIEELNASISEVAAKTKENASGANEANQLASLVKGSVEQGNLHMAEMLKAMKETALIQGSIEKSDAGTDIANNTAKALSEIVAGVTKTVEIISEIAKSTNEQAFGITQINSGLNQVSLVVQNNAAIAEESAASSGELSGQAELLKELINQFRLRSDTDTDEETSQLQLHLSHEKRSFVDAAMTTNQKRSDKY